MSSFSIAAVFFTFLSCSWCLSFLLSSYRARRGAPPGPLGLPILGHLHMLGNLPHRALQRLAKKYGPIMSIRLGVVPVVIVSSPEWAKVFLKTHDAVFASRPTLEASEYLGYGHSKGLVVAPYGSYWRSTRKLCTLELLTSSKIQLYEPMRKEELVKFVESVKTKADSCSVVDIDSLIESVIEDMTFRMLFGTKNIDRSNFRSSMQELTRLAGIFNLADYIPYIGALDPQGLRPRFKAVHKECDELLENIINEHVHDAKESQGEHNNFISVMLSTMESNNTHEVHLDRDNIKGIMLDMLGAATDTSSTATGWVLAELLRNPRVMKLAQEELKEVVGLDRMVEERDLVKLDYLNMVIKESMRLHAVIPLPMHESIEDVTVGGYFLPKGSKVLINIWELGRDTNAWSENAEEFYPERFIGSTVDLQGQDFQLLPFGSGRRKCPGMQLGLSVVQLVLAQLIHCFNLELPEGLSPKDISMSEKFGLTMPRADHLRVVPTYRLHTTDSHHPYISAKGSLSM